MLQLYMIVRISTLIGASRLCCRRLWRADDDGDEFYLLLTLVPNVLFRDLLRFAYLNFVVHIS